MPNVEVSQATYNAIKELAAWTQISRDELAEDLLSWCIKNAHRGVPTFRHMHIYAQATGKETPRKMWIGSPGVTDILPDGTKVHFRLDFRESSCVKPPWSE